MEFKLVKSGKSEDSAREQVERMRKEYTAHHTYDDGKMEFVDKDVHDAFKHTGGHAVKKEMTSVIAYSIVPAMMR